MFRRDRTTHKVLRIAGRKGSKSCREIVKGTPVKKYFFGRGSEQYHTDILINYGLAGSALNNFYIRSPKAKRIPTVNAHIGHSKLRAINMAKKEGILVPDSRVSLGLGDSKKEWIEKRYSSQGGIGICMARGKGQLQGKYYQKLVANRVYELRVHGFKWIDSNEWRIQKRYGSRENNEIAWNYHNGGRFVTVKNGTAQIFQDAREITSKVLDMLGMSFGAADFLVDTERNLYFIEMNSAPGFQELSKEIYVGAFNRLTELNNFKGLV